MRPEVRWYVRKKGVGDKCCVAQFAVRGGYKTKSSVHGVGDGITAQTPGSTTGLVA